MSSLHGASCAQMTEPERPYEYGERNLGDMSARQLKFGAGNISAYIAGLLGWLCLFAVLCFRYPEYLTTPELREVYNVDLLRLVLQVTLTAGLALGIVSTVRSQNKRHVAASGLICTAIAVMMGGYHVQGRAVQAKAVSAGVDWFVLDLLASILIFVTLEKLFPKYKEQPVLRPAWKLDLSYFALNHLLIGAMLLVANNFAPSFFAWAVHDSVRDWMHALPLPLELLVLMLAADFVQYWVHRAFHEIAWLWPFHAVHHSTEYMDWLAGSRMHLVQELCDRALVVIPLYLLGPSQSALNLYVGVATIQAVFVHANVGWRFGPLKYLFVTPQFHHWHHSKDKPAIDTNYSVHMPIWDKLFGTYHLPGEHWPKDYGTVHPLPAGIGQQFLYPFRRSSREP